MKIRDLILLLSLLFLNLICSRHANTLVYHNGAIVRGDTTQKQIALVFTGGDFNDGGDYICQTLKENNIKAGFFFTGDFYRNPENKELITNLINNKNYLGPHSDKHLLYCTWKNRDSLLVSRDSFAVDLKQNYNVMKTFGLDKKTSPIFLPPYEWYNQQISDWCQDEGIDLINMSYGTLSHTDYMAPDEKNYHSSNEIFVSILDYEKKSENGLNGFILLIHIGTFPERTDKFYYKLDQLINNLQQKRYEFLRIDKLIG